MKTHQLDLLNKTDCENFSPRVITLNPDLILIFGGREILSTTNVVNTLKSAFPDSIVTGCSTSGEISSVNVNDDTIAITAIKFDNTPISYQEVDINEFDNGRMAGKAE